MDYDADSADPEVVARFKRDGALDDEAVAIATLSVIWYIDPEGEERVGAKIDGNVRLATLVGDLAVLSHDLIHDDDPFDRED